MSALLAGRRARLTAMLILATAAISVLVIVAAGSSLSYYVTPEEFLEQVDREGTRWRVAGRVNADSIVKQSGSPVAFSIRGYEGAVVEIAYDGAYPNLFGPNSLVIVEGTASGAAGIDASSVIIKHENEFVTDPEDSPAYAPERE